MLWVDRGTDAAHGLVQHEVARRAALLQDYTVALDTAELAHLDVRVTDDLAVDPHTPFHQQQAHLLAVETGQVAEETVDTHRIELARKRAASLRDRRVFASRLRLLGTARAQAGLVAGFGWQGVEYAGGDAHGKAPAGLGSGAWVGQGATVAGAAGGAEGAVRHIRFLAVHCRRNCARFVWPGTAPCRHGRAGCAGCPRLAAR
ncbi:hypothetical protein D3C85_923760 [compost metagenome]